MYNLQHHLLRRPLLWTASQTRAAVSGSAWVCWATSTGTTWWSRPGRTSGAGWSSTTLGARCSPSASVRPPSSSSLRTAITETPGTPPRCARCPRAARCRSSTMRSSPRCWPRASSGATSTCTTWPACAPSGGSGEWWGVARLNCPHFQALVCEGVGGGVQTEDGDSHPLLDRGPPQWALAVAWQGRYRHLH